MSDAPDSAEARQTARQAGIDLAVLDRMLSSMDADDRTEILTLCAQDLDSARQGAELALRDWDPDTLARHLHVMSSLARTFGADALADEAARMQVRLSSGAVTGFDAGAQRMDDLALKAARFLSEAIE